MRFKVLRVAGCQICRITAAGFAPRRWPGPGTRSPAAAHEEAKQRLMVRNLRGGKRAMAGFFTPPDAGLTDEYLASDFWTIRIVQWFNQATRHNL
jgi:hypothetical protein